MLPWIAIQAVIWLIVLGFLTAHRLPACRCYPVFPNDVERVMENARGTTHGITPKQCHLMDKCGFLEWDRIDPAQNRTLPQKEVKAMIDRCVAFQKRRIQELGGAEGPAWCECAECTA